MTEPTDLIERLRTHFDECPPRIGDTSATRPLLTEAADEITALRDRVAALEGALERIVSAPMIDHRHPENSAQNIARSILSRAQQGGGDVRG